VVKRILVTLDEEQYELLQKLKGFGLKDAEKLRSVFLIYSQLMSIIKVMPYSVSIEIRDHDSEYIKNSLLGLADHLHREYKISYVVCNRLLHNLLNMTV